MKKTNSHGIKHEQCVHRRSTGDGESRACDEVVWTIVAFDLLDTPLSEPTLAEHNYRKRIRSERSATSINVDGQPTLAILKSGRAYEIIKAVDKKV